MKGAHWLLAGALALASPGCTRGKDDSAEGVVARAASEFRWSFRDVTRFRTAGVLVMLAQTTQPYPEDRETLNKARTLVTQVFVGTKTFEAALSDADHARITAGLDARLALARKGYLLDMETALCPKGAYAEMRQGIGIETVARDAVSVAILAGLYEDLNRPTYYARLLELIEERGCKDDACEAARVLYADGVETMSKAEWRTMIEGHMKTQTEALVQAGHAEAEIKDYVMRLATRYPACLGMVNLSLSEKVAADVTVARGLFIFEQLSQMALPTNQTPSLEQVKVVGGHPIKGSKKDGWATDYVVQARDGKVRLVSAGPDGEADTGDDVDIGTYAR